MPEEFVVVDKLCESETVAPLIGTVPLETSPVRFPVFGEVAPEKKKSTPFSLQEIALITSAMNAAHRETRITARTST